MELVRRLCLNPRFNFIQLPSLLLLACFPALLEAQEPRYELGVRERRYELAWNDASPEQRAAAVPSLEKAVTSFFSLQLGEAMKQLDRAWLAAAPNQDHPLARYGAALSVSVDRRWIDQADASLQLQLKPAYDTEQTAPESTQVIAQLLDAQGSLVAPQSTWSLNEVTETVAFRLGELPEGDYQLHVQLTADEQRFELPPVGISLSHSPLERVARLNEIQRELLQSQGASTRQATLGSIAALLKRLADGNVEETNYPAHRLLVECEALGQPDGSLAPWFDQSLDIDHWLTLSANRRRVVVRIKGPAQPQKPLPVLIALHGAGGSENMFFDAYGAGRLVDLGVERGWLVVAPRQTVAGLPVGVADLLDALEPLVAIDRSRVFVAGHSMGAAQAINQASQFADQITAVAAVGGGGNPGNNPSLKQLPFFVAAGDRDFGRGGARNLANRLQRLGAPTNYVEYPETEHLGVMQTSLDDVFRFFDQHTDSNGETNER